MLGRRHERARPQAVAALEAVHLRHGHARAEIGVFAGAFYDAAPARVARNIDHGREGPVQPGRGGFIGGHARGAFFALRRPGRRQREGHGEDGPIAMDHVHGKQQRNTEARLFDGGFLQFAQGFRAGHMKIGAHLSGAHALELGIVQP